MSSTLLPLHLLHRPLDFLLICIRIFFYLLSAVEFVDFGYGFSFLLLQNYNPTRLLYFTVLGLLIVSVGAMDLKG